MRRTPARYEQVAETLRSRITGGDYAVGDSLPSETDLCKEFAVSRYTVREALRRLSETGFVSRRQGSGTVVQATRAPQPFQQSLRTVDDLLQYATGSEFQFEHAGEVDADERLAVLVGGEVGRSWTKLTGVRRMDGRRRPVAYTEVFLDSRFKDARLRLSPGHEPVFRQIEEQYGVHVHRVEQELHAVLLTPEQAALLNAESGSAALQIVRRYFDPAQSGPQAIPYEVSISYHPGDRYFYRFSLDRP